MVDGNGAVPGGSRQVLAIIARTIWSWRPVISAATKSSPSSTPRSTRSRQIVITHPDFPSQNLSIPDQGARGTGCVAGALLDTPHTGKVDWERWPRTSAQPGLSAPVLSTADLAASNPPVEDGMALVVDRLLAAGFDDEEVRVMAVANTRLAGKEAT